MPREADRLALALVLDPTVVDATAIYHSLVAKDEPVYLYEDHPCVSPPFSEAAISYVNEHGNVVVMHATADTTIKPWDTESKVVDWSRVKWALTVFVWIGGQGGSGPVPTTGPVHMWWIAVYDDGEPADIHWIHIAEDVPLEQWDMAQLVLLGSLNFLNCRNVALVDPVRPRAEARRVARTGVKVHTINVLPTGSSTRGSRGDPVGVPLASVRGHFACYGPEYDRELLFGKYAGRYWRPQHARGSKEHGESQADYRLAP